MGNKQIILDCQYCDTVSALLYAVFSIISCKEKGLLQRMRLFGGQTGFFPITGVKSEDNHKAGLSTEK